MKTYPRLSIKNVCIQRVSSKHTLVRTQSGISLFKLIGECIAAGGSVQMDITDNRGTQHATGVLDYAPTE